MVREGRRYPTSRERRRNSAVEHLRAFDQHSLTSRSARGVRVRASAGRLMPLRPIQTLFFLSFALSLSVVPVGAQQRQTILGRKEAEKKLPVKKEAPKDTVTAPTAAKTGTAEITGVLVDSLHGTYLRHAEVIVEGAQQSVTSDSVGRFKISGLKPG